MHTDLPVVEVRENDLEELDRQFARALLFQIHPLIQRWGAVATESQLREAQSDLLRSLADEETASRLAGATSIPRLPRTSFKSRLIVFNGRPLLAAIRFRDKTGEPPYVCFSRSSIPLGSISDWSSLTRGLSRLFSEFKPVVALFFHPSHLPLNAPTTGIDDHLLAAPAQLMAERPRASEVPRVSLERSTNLDFYPRYKAIYEATYAERPALHGEVRTETEESLAYCLNEGLLFEIVVDGKWAGLVAGKWRTLVGIHGVFMVEIVLAPEVRGQRLGPAVHQLFATAVAKAEPRAVIMGTISEKNPWSRQAALRAGRIEIGAWHWIGL